MIMTCSTSHCLMTVLGIYGMNECMYVITLMNYSTNLNQKLPSISKYSSQIIVRRAHNVRFTLPTINKEEVLCR